MDINRTRSSASADAGHADSAGRAEGVQTQPGTLQFANSAPPRDLVAGLANLRTHTAERAAASDRHRVGTSGSSGGNTSERSVRPADIRQAVTMLKVFGQHVAAGLIDTQSRWQQARIVAHGAFIEGRDAHAALNALDRKQRMQFERNGDAGSLIDMTLTAASLVLATYESELAALKQRVRDYVRAASATMPLGGPDHILAIEPAYAANAERLDQMIEELKPYRETQQAFLAPYLGPNAPGNAEKMRLTIDTAAVGIASGHDIAMQIDQERVKTNVARIARYGADTRVLARTLAMIQSFGKEEAETLDRITDRHQDPRATVSADEKAWLQAYIENLDGHADYFCLRASEQAQHPHAERDALLLDIADALGSLLLTLEAIRSQPKLPDVIANRSITTTIGGQLLRRPEDEQASAALSGDKTNARHDDWAVPIPVSRAEQPRARRAGKARTRPGGGRAREAGTSQAGAQTSGPSQAAGVARSEATVAAQVRLRRFAEPAPLPDMSVAAFLALGKRLKMDTAALEMMADPACNPLSLGTMMRSSIESWFGNRAQWQRAANALGPATESGDDAHAQLHRALAQRIAGIDALLEQVDTLELDLTKRYMFPKAVHVDKLLTAGAVASVSSLRVLPPFDAADPSKGTTFEAEIRLRPTSDGNAAASLYLHLHTATPVDTQTCRALGFDQLEAKHVKTADQSRLGRTWETFQRTVLGNDTRVHRGPMTPAVLAKLKRRMQEQL